jgi:hypothetical protein
MTDRKSYDHMVKIWFALNPEDWHGSSTESMWAEPIAQTAEGGAYRLMNSPFYAFGVSFLDTVHAARNSEGALQFDRVIKRSGHSTFMLLVPQNSLHFGSYWKKLEELGCSYEWGHENTSRGEELLYSVDVPDAANLTAVLRVLEQGAKEGVWDYQEGHDSRKQP